MSSSDDKPTLWDIRSWLLSSLDFAEDFAHNRSEHAVAVTRFVQDIRRLKKELMNLFKDDLVLSPLHDIVNGLTGARAMASIMAERHPEKSGPLTRFVEGLKDAQDEFIRKVRAGGYPQA